MWMHNNRYFLAIGRGDQKILFAFSMYASLQFLLRALSGINFQGGSRCVTSL